MAAEPMTARHHAPGSNRDYDFFYEGLEDSRLLVQQCESCQTLRSPPMPMCPHCNSLSWTARALSGNGLLHSFVVHRHPPLPNFDVPHPVGLVDLEEGVRLVGAMDGTPPDEIAIGMAVRVEFVRRGKMASFRFRPA